MGASPDSISICTVVRNEGRYLLEWIAYHHTIGIRDIFIYDNESSDHTPQLLSELQKKGYLHYMRWATPPDRSPQLSAFEHYIKANQSECNFVALIDLDEFIVLPEDCRNINEYFFDQNLFRREIGAIAVNQRVFGSSGEINYRPEYVIERFHMTADADYAENCWFKSFSRPSLVSGVPNPHYVRLKAGLYVTAIGQELDEDSIATGKVSAICDGLRINHYIIKSLEEFRAKQQRGGGAGATAEVRSRRYTDGFFFGREVALSKVSWRFPAPLLAEVHAVESQLVADVEWTYDASLELRDGVVASTWKLDFGSGAPCAGYSGIDSFTRFRADQGYGWISNPGLEERDRQVADRLLGRFVLGKAPATLRLAVPPGKYRVCIVMGDQDYGNHVLEVRLSETEEAFPLLTAASGEYAVLQAVIDVTTTFVDLRLASPAANWVINWLVIEPANSEDSLGADVTRGRFGDANEYGAGAEHRNVEQQTVDG
jgi:hypothetical protein